MSVNLLSINIRPGNPDFQDLPWDHPVEEWKDCCVRLEEVQRGLSRHPVVFVNYDGKLYALKEMSGGIAKKEYDLLLEIENLHLPGVKAAGYAITHHPQGESGVLITRYLDRSLPYRSLFIRSGLIRYREHLLDAMSGLLVQFHVAGIFWGDCSLSNTLFRRDAGALQAYMVDAETAEVHPPRLSPTLRYHDLEIMEENINGEVSDLTATGLMNIAQDDKFPYRDMGSYIRERYQRLWEEISREQIISADERYRIQERIRALNKLGFSVGGIEMQTTESGDKLRLRVVVTDRNFHQNQLMGLTGLQAEEKQARAIMNEIYELKATLSQTNNRSTPLSVAAYYWLEHNYQPVLRALGPLLAGKDPEGENLSPTELYCQVLEHKWYLSEREHRDVGHQAAAEDYVRNLANT